MTRAVAEEGPRAAQHEHEVRDVRQQQHDRDQDAQLLDSRAVRHQGREQRRQQQGRPPPGSSAPCSGWRAATSNLSRPWRRPPASSARPSTSSVLPTMLPVIDALTRVKKPWRRASRVMISSAALPKVAFSRPPYCAPRCSASCPVAWPISPPGAPGRGTRRRRRALEARRGVVRARPGARTPAARRASGAPWFKGYRTVAPLGSLKRGQRLKRRRRQRDRRTRFRAAAGQRDQAMARLECVAQLGQLALARDQRRPWARRTRAQWSIAAWPQPPTI